MKRANDDGRQLLGAKEEIRSELRKEARKADSSTKLLRKERVQRVGNQRAGDAERQGGDADTWRRLRPSVEKMGLSRATTQITARGRTRTPKD